MLLNVFVPLIVWSLAKVTYLLSYEEVNCEEPETNVCVADAFSSYVELNDAVTDSIDVNLLFCAVFVVSFDCV
jgi:hypothetical protein